MSATATLKFAIGDKVTFTNENGVKFSKIITGFYKPTGDCPLYKMGRRYLLNTDSFWFPVFEHQLQAEK